MRGREEKSRSRMDVCSIESVLAEELGGGAMSSCLSAVIAIRIRQNGVRNEERFGCEGCESQRRRRWIRLAYIVLFVPDVVIKLHLVDAADGDLTLECGEVVKWFRYCSGKMIINGKKPMWRTVRNDWITVERWSLSVMS